MPPPTSSTPRPPSSPPHLERSEEWSGVRPGDPVEVAGVRARSTSWSFLAHVRNLRTGEEWVEVVGGRAGTRAVRSFRPEQIFPPSPSSGRRGTSGARSARGALGGGGARGARRARAPLIDEPRLPL